MIPVVAKLHEAPNETPRVPPLKKVDLMLNYYLVIHSLLKSTWCLVPLSNKLLKSLGEWFMQERFYPRRRTFPSPHVVKYLFES